jgi:hypothetical protein
MSKCATCDGTGKVSCPSCHGQGFTTRQNEDGESIQRLCWGCQGKRQITCGVCRGTGESAERPAAAAHPPPAAARPQAPADRLAGRWTNSAEGTWYEFVPDGHAYRVTGGGRREVAASGTARLVGQKVVIDATDKVLGRYNLELDIHGNMLDGIDRKAGFPIPVSFRKG